MAVVLNSDPAWSSILSGVIQGYGIVQQEKNAKAAKERQQQIDAQNSGIANAQMQLYGAEAKKDAADVGVEQSQIGKNTAYNRAIGEDPSGNPLQVNTSGIQLQPGNKGKKSPVTLQQQYQATLQAYKDYAKQGVNDQHNPYYAPLQNLNKQITAQSAAIANANLEQERQKGRLQLKGTPSYANLHHVGRASAASGVDDDTYNYADSVISKSPNPIATAAHLAAVATEHGAKKPTIDAIRDLGTYYSGKKDAPLRSSAPTAGALPPP